MRKIYIQISPGLPPARRLDSSPDSIRFFCSSLPTHSRGGHRAYLPAILHHQPPSRVAHILIPQPLCRITSPSTSASSVFRLDWRRFQVVFRSAASAGWASWPHLWPAVMDGVCEMRDRTLRPRPPCLFPWARGDEMKARG